MASKYDQVVLNSGLKVEFAYNGVTAVFVGEAESGVADSFGAWRVRCLLYNESDTTKLSSVKWAGGVSSFTNTWSGRTSAVYS